MWNVRKQVVFWRSFFMVFPLVALTWDTIFNILGVQNLSFDRPVASIFLPWGPFCQLGTPERTMEGHMGAQNQIFSDFCWFWLILGARFESVLGSNGLNSFVFFWACFQVTVCVDFWVGLLTVGALKARFSHGRYCKNHVFAKTVYWWFEARFLVFFGGPGSRFSWFFCLGNRLENGMFFKVDLGTLNGTRK